MSHAAQLEVAQWEARIPETEWTVYQRVIHEARRSGVRFAFGGAFATTFVTTSRPRLPVRRANSTAAPSWRGLERESISAWSA